METERHSSTDRRAEIFHEMVRELEEQKGQPLTYEDLTELDGLMDEMVRRGQEAGELATAAAEVEDAS
jgi:hypothetical protein